MDVMLTRRTVMFYEFVEDAVAKRAPLRPEHIALVHEWMADGRMLHGGAIGDPPTGGLIVFASEDPAVAEKFAALDPYVQRGLVTSRRVEPWNVVT